MRVISALIFFLVGDYSSSEVLIEEKSGEIYVTWTYKNDLAKSVFLIGNFNQWQHETAFPLTKGRDGEWKIVKKFQLGDELLYEFLVDKIWSEDPNPGNVEILPIGFGGQLFFIDIARYLKKEDLFYKSTPVSSLHPLIFFPNNGSANTFQNDFVRLYLDSNMYTEKGSTIILTSTIKTDRNGIRGTIGNTLTPEFRIEYFKLLLVDAQGKEIHNNSSAEISFEKIIKMFLETSSHANSYNLFVYSVKINNGEMLPEDSGEFQTANSIGTINESLELHFGETICISNRNLF